MLFLPQWKRIAFYGAAAALFIAPSLSPASAWEYRYWGPRGDSSGYWQPHWSSSTRHHRRHKHDRSRDASIAAARKPTGPLLIVVSVAQQKATVFAGSEEIASTPVSTGVPGHPTPLGVFSVIQKQVYHESNLYSAAPMPYMQRITWSGIALHAGVVPGHPASHGCIRLPRDFAVRLYGTTKIGVRVVVTADDPVPVGIEHHALLQRTVPSEKAAESSQSRAAVVAAADIRPLDATRTEATGSATSDAAPAPVKEPEPPVKAAQRNGGLSLFVSRKEGKLYARYKFATLFEMPVSISEPEKPIGTHVFTATEMVGEGPAFRWNVLTIPSRASAKKHVHEHRARKRQTDDAARAERASLPSASAALDRVTIPDEARARVADLLAPGASLIISDNGLSDETDSDTDFVVLTP